LAHERDAQRHGRVGELQDEPVLAHPLHPGARHRGHVAVEEDPEVARAHAAEGPTTQLTQAHPAAAQRSGHPSTICRRRASTAAPRATTAMNAKATRTPASDARAPEMSEKNGRKPRCA